MEKIQLGDEVKDSVTGFRGIAVARTTWMTGCARITVQPKGQDKDGKCFEPTAFDEPMLIVLKAKVVKEDNHKTGGPRPLVYQKPNLAFKK